jgi:hypothetical protein
MTVLISKQASLSWFREGVQIARESATLTARRERVSVNVTQRLSRLLPRATGAVSNVKASSTKVKGSSSPATAVPRTRKRIQSQSGVILTQSSHNHRGGVNTTTHQPGRTTHPACARDGKVYKYGIDSLHFDSGEC